MVALHAPSRYPSEKLPRLWGPPYNRLDSPVTPPTPYKPSTPDTPSKPSKPSMKDGWWWPRA